MIRGQKGFLRIARQKKAAEEGSTRSSIESRCRKVTVEEVGETGSVTTGRTDEAASRRQKAETVAQKKAEAKAKKEQAKNMTERVRRWTQRFRG